MSQQELLVRVAATLDRLGVEYLVTGSVASSFHGQPRATHDADLVIALSRDSAPQLAASFPETEFYLSIAAIHEAIASGGMFNILSVDSGDKIDCWMLTNSEFDQSRFARRKIESLFGSKLSIQTVEDTIVSKLMWAKESDGSEKQLADIRSIVELRSEDLDFAYIHRWVDSLDLDALWSQCQSE